MGLAILSCSPFHFQYVTLSSSFARLRSNHTDTTIAQRSASSCEHLFRAIILRVRACEYNGKHRSGDLSTSAVLPVLLTTALCVTIISHSEPIPFLKTYPLQLTVWLITQDRLVFVRCSTLPCRLMRRTLASRWPNTHLPCDSRVASLSSPSSLFCKTKCSVISVEAIESSSQSRVLCRF